MKVKFLVISILIFHNIGFGQVGGNAVYEFLNLTNAARSAALGGNMLAVYDDDLNLAFQNPSLLNPDMDNHFVLNYVGYFADINYGFVGYSKSFEKLGSFAGGIQFVNYGVFDQADELGNITGTFFLAEHAFNLMYARPVDSSFVIGINIKPVISELEENRSYGLVGDAGISYYSHNKLFSGALVLKNMGSQIKPYRPNHFEPVPFQIQAGISQKLEHAPFRISLVAEHLQQYDLTYQKGDEEESNLFVNADNAGDRGFVQEHADKIMRHIILGVEILPFPNFYINLGYNYRRRQELKIDTRSYLVGGSWGFGVKISKFHISYARASYHLAGGSNHFTLSTNFSEFYRKI